MPEILERTVVIDTDDGAMESFVAHPASAGAHPVVLLYMDAVGYRDELLGFARRFALAGYYGVLPNLYYRDGGPSFDPFEPFKQLDRILPLAHALTNDRVMADTKAVLAFLGTDPAARRGAKGCVGYCMGGRMALAATGTFPDDFPAAVSLYGGRQVTDAADSPHLVAMKTKGEIYLGFAEEDRHVPDEQVERIDAAFRRGGLAYTLEHYPGTVHGFAFPERVFYNEAAAERSWERVFDLFERRVRRVS